jgi:hypothetical protein
MMSAVVGCKSGDRLFIFDEYAITNSNTRELCERITQDYPNREMTSFPDPSGRARKTSAIGGETDFTIIESFGIETIAPSKAPHIADSLNNLNTLMLNGAGERRIIVHPRCTELIKCLNTWEYEEDSDNRPDKKSGRDHLPDSLKYLVWSEFNMQGRKVQQVKIKGF